MRFAALLLLLTSFAIADEGAKPSKIPLSPELQMKNAIAEYRELVADWSKPGKNIGELLKANNKKREQIIELHQSLGIKPDKAAYEKAKADETRLESKLKATEEKMRDKNTTNIADLAEEATRILADLREANLLRTLNAPAKRKKDQQKAGPFNPDKFVPK